MVELVLTWGFVEENLELVLERVKRGDKRAFDAMKILFKVNRERFMDLLNAWEKKDFTEYYRKWGKDKLKQRFGI